MKITKQIESEILLVMDDYWSSYFRGDLETWASYLPDDYRNIGSTKAELWNSKKEIVDFTLEVLDQTVGKAELRNKKTQIIPYEPYIMVHEFGDLHVNAEEGWIFYAPFRLSSLLENTSDGWKILHQHGSFPDAKAEEGEAFGFDQLKVENKKLRDAIQSRTNELAQKNRELELEAALERVRAVAMSMRTSKELQGVGEIIFNELKALGFNDLRNTEIIINQDIKQTILSYYYSDYGVSGRIVVDYTSHPLLKKWAEDLKTAGDGFASVHISEREMEEWIKYREDLGYLPDPKLNLAKTLDYYSYSTGLGALSISSFQPITQEQLTTLQRFRNVFGLAYRRYLDVVNAETQAKEAQIEAALERVRARTMAMHKSEELLETGALLFKELSKLDVEIFNCGYVLMDDKAKMGWNYGVNPGDGTIRSLPTGVPQTGTKVLENITESWQKQEPYLIIELDPQETIEHQTWIAENMPNLSLTKEQLLAITPERLAIHTFNFKHGYLLLVGSESLAAAQKEMVVRFAKVFEQTYTRFLDLQRAEAQTREAQIEAALERVRAQTMAMHNSEDVGKCIVKMFGELTALGVDEDTRFGIGILNHDDENNQLWTASKDGDDVKMHIGNLDMRLHPLLKSARRAWKEQVPLHTYVLEGEDLMNYYQTLNSAPDYKFQTAIEKLPEREFHYGFVFDHGFFYAFNSNEFEPDVIHIIQRFSSQFGQTYQRYLDLVKAEEQAREAQIEAALEKVRSSSLAVNNVDEFNDVVRIAFQKLSEFQIPISSLCIATVIEGTKDFELFGCGESESGLTTLKFKLPYFPNAFIDDLLNERISSIVGYFSKVYGEEEKNSYYDYALKNTELKHLPDDIKQQIHQCKSYGLSTAYGLNSMIMVNDMEGNILDEGQADIVQRFSTVFEQAYIRFLDLQKAEAQAREAQIEAALEKVRSRTMAMQQSDELNDVIQVLFEQFIHLNIFVQHTGFLIDYRNREDMLIWLADEHAVFPQISIPYFDSPHWNSFLEAKEKGLELFTNHLSFEEKNKFYRELFTHIPDLTEDTKEKYFQCPGLAISTALMDNIGLYIENFEGLPYSNEENNILLRFGTVFQQAYTRFLDLQRAEAQAREAQIEAALERTRTQSMLMQQSDELNKVSNAFHEQLLLLGLPTEFSYVWLPDEGNQTHMFWATWSKNHDSKTSSFSKSITYPLDKSEPYTAACYEMWESDHSVFVNRIAPEEVINFFSSWGELMSEAEHMRADRFPEGLYYAEAYMKYGCFGINIARSLSEDEQQILQRFSIEFERAYTRFLDLKKAEAQAREAQIETALEKVRSRTMAMQNSEELPEAANLLFHEIQALGIPTWSAGYNVLSDDKRSAECWMSSEGAIQPPFTLYYQTEKSFIEQYDFFCSDESFMFQELSGKALVEHYDYMKSIPKIGEIILDLEHSGISLPTHQINHFCKFEQGYLLFITYEPVPEAHELFMRFTKVFEQTYTRFLDLQKAEAQAREAQIESALEKVRSRTIAMQKADELHEVVTLVVEKLMDLGVILDANGAILCTYFTDSKDVLHWIASPDFSFTGSYLLPYFEHPIFRAAWESRLNGDEYFSKSFSVEEKNSFFEYAFEHSDYKHFPDEFKEWVFQNDKHSLSFAWTENAAILIPSHTGVVPEGEDIEILKRFARVFEQAYVRFMDLQVKEEQSAKLAEEKQRLEKTLNDLQATQNQLIQAEKMASLGELTAGIAHEIKNPLNFVNNFSELSSELLDEMVEEIEKGDQEEAFAIVGDLKQNLQKILEHGRRADGIVKGMLMHSRGSSGDKEMTDVNALCDEYLRLAYHGLRAKDSTFNAGMETNFDDSLPKIEIVPQEMGRVLLNLITNAFYAVHEKSKTIGETDYQPKVSVSTNTDEGTLTIAVTDNGTGIPDDIKKKIFQPFFTTKPTGSGTGLGLSLSYDIVKAHGGTLEVLKTGESGTTFQLRLPVN